MFYSFVMHQFCWIILANVILASPVTVSFVIMSMSVSSVFIAVTIIVLVLMVLKMMVTSIKVSMSAPLRDIIVIEMPVASISTTVNVMMSLCIMTSLVCNANVCYTNVDCTDTISSYQCPCAGGYN